MGYRVQSFYFPSDMNMSSIEKTINAWLKEGSIGEVTAVTMVPRSPDMLCTGVLVLYKTDDK